MSNSLRAKCITKTNTPAPAVRSFQANRHVNFTSYPCLGDARYAYSAPHRSLQAEPKDANAPFAVLIQPGIHAQDLTIGKNGCQHDAKGSVTMLYLGVCTHASNQLKGNVSHDVRSITATALQASISSAQVC